ncbi:hypothetical protein HZS_7838 [Henneguya salminicola]|nr:hypothetical protein HZS_7838 [Henneguya salminicola]
MKFPLPPIFLFHARTVRLIETAHLIHYKKWEFKKTFEDCLIRDFMSRLFDYPCLFKPMNMSRIFRSCGDTVQDYGEQCDCGPNELCEIKKKGRCCNPKTCKFKNKNIRCMEGECCRNCKNVICRASAGECDITDKCDGKSAGCPLNKVRENYELCKDNKAYINNNFVRDFALMEYMHIILKIAQKS